MTRYRTATFTCDCCGAEFTARAGRAPIRCRTCHKRIASSGYYAATDEQLRLSLARAEKRARDIQHVLRVRASKGVAA